MPGRPSDNRLENPPDRVCVHATATVSPSAVLQAELEYSIEIGAGASVGEGCWLHAYSGDIKIESGVVLGSGVLIVGWSEVGELSTVGASTTLFETAIAAGSAISAHSVLGVPERPIALVPAAADFSDEVDNLPDPWSERPASPIEPAPPPISKPVPPTTSGFAAEGTDRDESDLESSTGSGEQPASPAEAAETSAREAPAASPSPEVYGRQHVTRIIDSILNRDSP
ncbi:MAG: hypothetical protein ACFB9N_03590 [Geitlerinemataceae cyanobacterium]